MKKITHQWLLITACFVAGISTIQPTRGEDGTPDQELSDSIISGDVVEARADEEEVNHWENSSVLLRHLWGVVDERVDPEGLRLYRIPTDQGRLLMLLGIFSTPQIRATPITQETAVLFESVRVHLENQKMNGEITESEEIIYRGLLPDANPEELHNAGEEVSKLRLINPVTEANFYWKAATHPGANPYDIRLAAESLTELDAAYYSDAVRFLYGQ